MIFSALKSGTIYFLIVFACAFALGVLRTLFIAPALGATIAVLLELPVILTISWLVCPACTKFLGAHDTLPARLVMGAFAFCLLMAVEFALGVTMFGQSSSEWFVALLTLPGLLGLAGQILFACIPAMQART